MQYLNIYLLLAKMTNTGCIYFAFKVRKDFKRPSKRSAKFPNSVEFREPYGGFGADITSLVSSVFNWVEFEHVSSGFEVSMTSTVGFDSSIDGHGHLSTGCEVNKAWVASDALKTGGLQSEHNPDCGIRFQPSWSLTLCYRFWSKNCPSRKPRLHHRRS